MKHLTEKEYKEALKYAKERLNGKTTSVHKVDSIAKALLDAENNKQVILQILSRGYREMGALREENQRLRAENAELRDKTKVSKYMAEAEFLEHKLKSQGSKVQGLVKALRFYAEGSWDGIKSPKFVFDKGDTAREALKGWESK